MKENVPFELHPHFLPPVNIARVPQPQAERKAHLMQAACIRRRAAEGNSPSDEPRLEFSPFCTHQYISKSFLKLHEMYEMKGMFQVSINEG